ncbi:MAG: glycogen debranching N-terminal domain-containing protein [Bacillota bacterium]
MLELRVAPREIEESFEVLKEGDLFLTSLPGGDIPGHSMAGLGLYYRDTRFLSRLEHFIGDNRPVLLSSSTRGSHLEQVELTNPEFEAAGGVRLPLQSLHLRLLRVVRDSLYQRLRVVNYNQFEVPVPLRVLIGADFRDIFEIRGARRPERGDFLPAVRSGSSFLLRYRGLDGIVRGCHVVFDPPPAEIRETGDGMLCTFDLILPPQRKVYLTWLVRPLLEPEAGVVQEWSGRRLDVVFRAAAGEQAEEHRRWRNRSTLFTSDNEVFNRMLERYTSDLRALYAAYPDGRIVEAGIPWYAAPFGRDSLITGMQTLILNPDLARDTLRFLGRHQGRTVDERREVQPGKILHELRRGEMANCGEILHTPYFGSVDATPLFVVLLGKYFAWTGDRALLTEMRENLESALAWCREYGDRDGGGYLEYHGQAEGGLNNQGWKDSWDAVVDPEGRPADPPIALVEVQGYWYQALEHGARLIKVLGDEHGAEQLRAEARQLKARFIRDFQVPGEDYLGFALDGKKRLLSTVVSNMGHCLWSGILDPGPAAGVVRRMFRPDMHSGWGIRTMSRWEKAYNPMSYHNGSVWPHDNAIIGAGLRRYGLLTHLEQLFTGFFEAAQYFPYQRLPELFCGFARRLTGEPVRYPIACDPQAWAIGSIFMFLQAALGLNCSKKGLHVAKPVLPGWLRELTVENVRVRGGTVDLRFSRSRGTTRCELLRQEGPVTVSVEE